MKIRNLLLLLVLLVVTALPISVGYAAGSVNAESLESVRVIKFWDDSDDLVVERKNGDRLLLQHNQACRTMSTEFPMQILWDGDKVVKAKVASNELCKVYNFGPYSSDLTIVKRISSSNILTKEHLAQVEWMGSRYEVDYGEGCKYLREFEGEKAYVHTPQSGLSGATLYLPKVRGQCTINSATFVESVGKSSSVQESPVKNLQYKAENNQVFFSWDDFPEDEKWLVFVAHSKYQFDPDEFVTSQLPGFKRSRFNSIRISQLVNDQPYFFYITASNADGELAPWLELPITPIQTARRIVNKPDPEKFEIEMAETDEAYHLVWPDKSEHSRKYMIMVYVNGKREIFKLIDAADHFFDVEKKPEWSNSSFRMTLRSFPKKPTGIRYFDSIFWKKD